jgi:protein ImuB
MGGVDQAPDGLAELIDHLHLHVPAQDLYRLVPHESHLPERSARRAPPLPDPGAASWPRDRARPVLLLPNPEPIDVVAPVPDYPPMMFQYKGRQHRIRRAEGPERIEAEWWRRQAELRDYYRLEDEGGARYWVYRLGHYAQEQRSRWFLHGFFG